MIEILVILFIVGVLAAIAVPSLSGMLASAHMNHAVTELRVALQESQRQSIRKSQSCETRFLIPENPASAAIVKGSCLTSGDRTLPASIGIATNVLPDTLPSASSAPTTSPIGPHLPEVHKAGLLEPLLGWVLEESSLGSNGQTIQERPSGQLLADSRDDDDDDDPVCRNYEGKQEKYRCQDPETETPDIDTGINIGVKDVGIKFGQSGAARFNLAYDETKIVPPSDHSAKFIAYRPTNTNGKKKCVVISSSLGLTRVGTYKGQLSPSEITHDGTCTASTWTQQ